jgi:mannose-1-phosphate guanylyltransferase
VLRYLETKEFPGLEVLASVESRPLGTAGAVGFARQWLQTDPVVVLNGDTMTALDLAPFAAEHRLSGAAASMACVRVPDPGRYGRVEIDGDGRVSSFREKAPAASPGWINGGVYMFGRAMLDRLAALPGGSLERDVLARMPAGSIHAFRTEGGFLDIGTPRSLAAAGDFASRWLPGLDPL